MGATARHVNQHQRRKNEGHSCVSRVSSFLFHYISLYNPMFYAYIPVFPTNHTPYTVGDVPTGYLQRRHCSLNVAVP